MSFRSGRLRFGTSAPRAWACTRRTVARARADNHRAPNPYRSMGCRHEGRSPCAVCIDGAFHATVPMARLQGPAAAADPEDANP